MHRPLSGPRVALALIALLTLVHAAGRPAAAAEKVALGPYLPPAAVGDWRTMENSQGLQSTHFVAEMTPWRRSGFRLLTRIETETSSFEETFVRKGRFYRGTIGEGDLRFVPEEPVRLFRSQLKPGVAQRYRYRARVVSGSDVIGQARVRGRLFFEGFDAIETPTGASYSDTLRLGQSERLVIRDRDSGERYELQVMQTRWLARGLGEVASRTRLRTLHDGVVTEDSGDIDAWVTGGQVGGAGLP